MGNCKFLHLIRLRYFGGNLWGKYGELDKNIFYILKDLRKHLKIILARC